jgi:long-subunit fatty acid transport protein
MLMGATYRLAKVTSGRRMAVGLALVLLLLGDAGALRAQIVPNLGGQRVGISAFQFLKIGVGARGVAMGEAFVAIADDGSALYWNPAGLAQTMENQVFVAHTEYVVDIKHEYVGATYRLTDADVIGVALTSLHMDDMEITTETQPLGTGRYFTFGDFGVGVSYGRKMTDQFSFGATLRYVQETLDMLHMRSMMVDLGTYYWTGLGTSRFAVVITNFGADVTPAGTVTGADGTRDSSFQSFSLPTVFKLGFALEPWATDDQCITASVQLNHPNDNAENVRLGVEYAWRKTFFLRGGVKRTIGQKLLAADETSEESFTLGTGFRLATGFTTVQADYAYANFSRLGSVHRISLTMTY